ncbi:metal ABC transporter permease [Spirochaeta africana]|uniref:ABC-type Mn2+/Zn2+ transport system, permease component n=1 Tax=Spirochaeta africana (strain ATCC 700263 / DSM 8902 / Z-7692) TaxID=889378 RepID=H9ULK7_SPIAZ|nr:metal ABC transporter permease [Spirochaeta africana]AFG38400.1 ABC-type Mn2+/Zn2+ transport system, permease component [Spirochaeta africana DSM 8902]
MSWLIVPLQYEFMRSAMLAAVLVAVACSTIGVYVVFRRMAFIGDALAHTVLPGLVVAYLNQLSMIGGAIIAGIASALAIGKITADRTVSEDTAIGITFSGMFALGILLMSRTGSFRDLSHMLFGNILGVGQTQLYMIAAIALVVPVALYFLHKELELSSYDPSHAEVIGLKIDRVRYLLLILLALTVVSGVTAVGVVLTSALIITPAAAASLLTRRLVPMILLSAAIGIVSGIGGLYWSFYWNVSSGAAIVLICTGLFAVAAAIERLQR